MWRIFSWLGITALFVIVLGCETAPGTDTNPDPSDAGTSLGGGAGTGGGGGAGGSAGADGGFPNCPQPTPETPDTGDASIATPLGTGARPEASTVVSIHFRPETAGEDEFRIERALFSPACDQLEPWVEVGQTPRTALNEAGWMRWNDSGAAPGAAYRYRVRAVVSGQTSHASDPSPVVYMPVADDAPNLPREEVDFTYPILTGKVWTVSSTGKQNDGTTAADFTTINQALAAAALGDEIHIRNGDVHDYPSELPKKDGSGWIVIRPEDMSFLPAQGTRVRPNGSYFSAHHSHNGQAKASTANTDDTRMPVLRARRLGTSTFDPAVRTEPGAHHYRLVGLKLDVEVDPNVTAAGNAIVRIVGSGTDLPHHIIIDRCWILGNPRNVTRIQRGVMFNGNHLGIIDSVIEQIIHSGADAQAIWTSYGNVQTVQNSLLEASGENWMGGGANVGTTRIGYIPSDLTFRRVFFVKRNDWNTKDPSSPGFGIGHVVKNLFEIKSAQRVLVEDSILEGSWTDAQIGYVFNLKISDQSGANPWASCHDVTIRRSKLRRANVMLTYHNAGNRRGHFAHIVADDYGTVVNGVEIFGGKGESMRFQASPHLRLENLTLVPPGTPSRIAYTGTAATNNAGLVVKDSIIRYGAYGWIGVYNANDKGNLDQVFGGGWSFSGNHIVYEGSTRTSNITDGVTYHDTMAQLGFVDFAGRNYRLQTGSPLKGTGTDGADPGADIDALELAVAGVDD
jgi:hypothetical protein